eukprot:CAMPEP_0198365588 /NCGR_PEP_ID=MMETSP1450-20131203/154247_1 /TAXON_ID=753684 ORGANISM="Madagascaria erythrocladiodes, Strain CCMP3234" /NCGR_SAMPLE_ID=MMETSP1450 /ASSEMBLY_ACC=CAM_ASM_001115 /LENGTH=194 /DNA_ID=CAMNT_0044073039 /DNA_START=393 /DNA_END=978 /DNA_ORIENTATION=-
MGSSSSSSVGSAGTSAYSFTTAKHISSAIFHCASVTHLSPSAVVPICAKRLSAQTRHCCGSRPTSSQLLKACSTLDSNWWNGSTVPPSQSTGSQSCTSLRSARTATASATKATTHSCRLRAAVLALLAMARRSVAASAVAWPGLLIVGAGRAAVLVLLAMARRSVAGSAVAWPGLLMRRCGGGDGVWVRTLRGD